MTLRPIIFILFFLGLSLAGAKESSQNPINAQDELFNNTFYTPNFELNTPAMLPLGLENTSDLSEIRVKIFPHTSVSGAHGPADDPKTVRLQSQDFITVKTSSANQYSGKIFKINSSSGKLLLTLEDGTSISETNKLIFTCQKPIEVYRYKAKDPKYTHSYNGVIQAVESNGQVVLINQVAMEEYLRGVVPAESPASWPIEALKAQAVAARTYATYHVILKRSGLTQESTALWDVVDTTASQVYTGVSGAIKSTDEAITQTSGEVMTYQGNIIIAYFASYTGGRSDSALNIFLQKDAPYCHSIDEIFSKEEISKELTDRQQWILGWSTDKLSGQTILEEFKKQSITSQLFKNFDPKKPATFSVALKNEVFDTIRFLRVTQGNNSVDLYFTKIRDSLKYKTNFPAYHVTMTQSGSTYQFHGAGYGHHVGLSQFGSMMMAKVFGKSYSEILNHYYNDIELQKIY